MESFLLIWVLGGHMTLTPLPSGFLLSLADGEHWEEVVGQREKGWGSLFLPCLFLIWLYSSTIIVLQVWSLNQQHPLGAFCKHKILIPTTDLLNHKLCGWDVAICGLNRPVRWFWCTRKFESYWSREQRCTTNLLWGLWPIKSPVVGGNFPYKPNGRGPGSLHS